MRRILTALILTIGLGFFSHPVVTIAAMDYDAYEAEAEVNVNGHFIQMDVHPVRDKNHLFIPIRTLESLGLTYSWNPSSQTTTIQSMEKERVKMEVEVGSKVAFINGIDKQMDAPAQIKNGRVLVPIRFVSENLGYHVNYETIRNIVFLTANAYKFDVSVLSQKDLQAARKAAISLPLEASFKMLGFSTKALHNYTFPAGRADMYLFNDSYTSSIVEIKDGKAVVRGQFVYGARSDFAYTAGNITDLADPVLRPLFEDNVNYSKNLNGTTSTYYTDDEGNPKRFSSSNSIKTYSDIIQKLPINK
ncbi:copper amine oxidase N-terminal domain-containing protein [Paenibacillus cellulositrophicus]|uniref:copper amine oxidase N-terminal domain-containing protein n=1 Tax=Paenibacillus cellulositrophicus TaxID=562959 RepID=UPI0012671F94|nr:copper amine oxidase N-terminal domain-containing protein [Paenibacillus cellulositrophicus]